MLKTLAPFLLLVMGVQTEFQQSDKFLLSISHRWRANEEHRISVTATIKSNAVIVNWGQQPRNAPYTRTYTLLGVERVEAMGDEGRPKRLSVRIEQLVGDGKPLCRPGTEVVIDNGQTKPDDSSVDDAAKAALHYLFSSPLLGHSDRGYNAIFGLDRPRSLGEKWAANPEAISELVSRTGYKVAPEHIRGSVQLSHVAGDDGIELSVVAELNDVKGALGNVAILGGTMHTRGAARFQRGPSPGEPLRWTQDSNSNLFGAGMAKDGHPFMMEMNDEHEVTSEILLGEPSSRPANK